MKRKIKVIDKATGKVIEGEQVIRNLDHFAVQLSTRAQVFDNKKKKDPKYKNKIIEDF